MLYPLSYRRCFLQGSGLQPMHPARCARDSSGDAPSLGRDDLLMLNEPRSCVSNWVQEILPSLAASSPGQANLHTRERTARCLGVIVPEARRMARLALLPHNALASLRE